MEYVAQLIWYFTGDKLVMTSNVNCDTFTWTYVIILWLKRFDVG